MFGLFPSDEKGRKLFLFTHTCTTSIYSGFAFYAVEYRYVWMDCQVVMIGLATNARCQSKTGRNLNGLIRFPAARHSLTGTIWRQISPSPTRASLSFPFFGEMLHVSGPSHLIRTFFLEIIFLYFLNFPFSSRGETFEWLSRPVISFGCVKWRLGEFMRLLIWAREKRNTLSSTKMARP